MKKININYENVENVNEKKFSFENKFLIIY
jgi:hypothetical protein